MKDIRIFTIQAIHRIFKKESWKVFTLSQKAGSLLNFIRSCVTNDMRVDPRNSTWGALREKYIRKEDKCKRKQHNYSKNPKGAFKRNLTLSGLVGASTPRNLYNAGSPPWHIDPQCTWRTVSYFFTFSFLIFWGK